ncbi:hypothetical protein Naga_101606g1, partial [Nannochloropsis gaditana]
MGSRPRLFPLLALLLLQTTASFHRLPAPLASTSNKSPSFRAERSSSSCAFGGAVVAPSVLPCDHLVSCPWRKKGTMMRATTEKEEAARDEEEERRAEAARQLSLELEKERSQVEASSRMARLQEVG